MSEGIANHDEATDRERQMDQEAGLWCECQGLVEILGEARTEVFVSLG